MSNGMTSDTQFNIYDEAKFEALFLTDLHVKKRPYGQVHCDQKNSLDGEVPNEITISFWELGGHPDLIPVLHPFISGEVRTFMLSKSLFVYTKR